jgi:hypothetical protein
VSAETEDPLDAGWDEADHGLVERQLNERAAKFHDLLMK